MSFSHLCLQQRRRRRWKRKRWFLLQQRLIWKRKSLELRVSRADLQYHWYKITHSWPKADWLARSHTQEVQQNVQGNHVIASSLSSSNDWFYWNFRIWLCSVKKEGGNLLSQHSQPAWSLPAYHWANTMTVRGKDYRNNCKVNTRKFSLLTLVYFP